MAVFLLLLLYLGSVIWLQRKVPALLTSAGLVRLNFQGVRIPVGQGLAALLSALIGLAFVALVQPELQYEIVAMVTVLVVFGGLGYNDDKLGDRGDLGLRGHVNALVRQGRITTGLTKACGGVIAALVITTFVLGHALPQSFPEALIIALAANTINLLDLRPGRACMVFILLAAGTVATRFGRAWPLLPLLISASAMYPGDRAAKTMMGDTGSNALGAALGLAWILSVQNVVVMWLIAAVLCIVNLAAERWSVSAIIDSNPTLRRLDALTGVRGSSSQ